MQSGGVQVGAPRSHTAQTLAVRAAGMSCFQARKNLFQIELEVLEDQVELVLAVDNFLQLDLNTPRCDCNKNLITRSKGTQTRAQPI